MFFKDKGGFHCTRVTEADQGPRAVPTVTPSFLLPVPFPSATHSAASWWWFAALFIWALRKGGCSERLIAEEHWHLFSRQKQSLFSEQAHTLFIIVTGITVLSISPHQRAAAYGGQHYACTQQKRPTAEGAHILKRERDYKLRREIKTLTSSYKAQLLYLTKVASHVHSKARSRN